MTRRILRVGLIVWGVLLAALIAPLVVDFSHGDAARGKLLYYGQGDPSLPCAVCHFHYAIAPAMSGISERVARVRLTTAENRSKSVTEYLTESILFPERYLVPNYPDTMHSVTDGSLRLQDVQDIVAYLMTL